jgi:hypothetical protein
MESSLRPAYATLTRLAVPILLPLVLAGCGTLTSKSFDITQPPSKEDIGGIPFTLNKPQFTITRVPSADGGPDVYQTKIDYVADSTQRYVIQMTPPQPLVSIGRSAMTTTAR